MEGEAMPSRRLAANGLNPNEPTLDLHKIAERYRALLELGDQMGVTPELEIWGHFRIISERCDV